MSWEHLSLLLKHRIQSVAYFVYFGILVWVEQPDAVGIWGILWWPPDKLIEDIELSCVLVNTTIFNTWFHCWKLSHLSLKHSAKKGVFRKTSYKKYFEKSVMLFKMQWFLFPEIWKKSRADCSFSISQLFYIIILIMWCANIYGIGAIVFIVLWHFVMTLSIVIYSKSK